MTIVGSAEQVQETIQGYIDLGITSFCLSGYPHDDEATRFGDLVMPVPLGGAKRLRTVEALTVHSVSARNEPKGGLLAE